ncbi:MAG: TetR family transcriptional regulator [Aeromicrobium sp.]|uniref:TetR family transcriptional regulator n=1 Tax=Aeromicrobium sp. TaxID=1871063 RepID=UPI0039E6F8B5
MANSLDDVVTAALGVLDEYGLEFCSMRRVAGALGVQPSALYHHVENKQTLLSLMAARLVDGVEIDADVAASMGRFRAAMLAVRDGAEVVATAAAFGLTDSPIEAALAERVGRDVARTLMIYVVGHTQATQLHRQAAAVGAIALDPDLDASFARGLAIICRA